MVEDTSCRMCGSCCYFEIPVTLLDIHRLSRTLRKEDRIVFQGCVQAEASRRSGLFKIRKQSSGACRFLSERQFCTIHPAKPAACRLFVCSLQQESEQGLMPWTANCLRPADRNTLWEQSVAAAITRAYIQRHGTSWDGGSYWKAVQAIQANVKIRRSQKLKLSRRDDGVPLALLYDCGQCAHRGRCAAETPITLDDVDRLADFLGMSWETVFEDLLEPEASSESGCFKLRRAESCILFDEGTEQCRVEPVRPLHCRFTPCPARSRTTECADRFFLGSGTIPEQFRHQVAMALTRQYIAEKGMRCDRDRVRETLREIEARASAASDLAEFCRVIAPYRYVDDTLLFSSAEGRMEGCRHASARA